MRRWVWKALGCPYKHPFNVACNMSEGGAAGTKAEAFEHQGQMQIIPMLRLVWHIYGPADSLEVKDNTDHRSPT